MAGFGKASKAIGLVVGIAAVNLPGIFYQPRDVDVLLYQAAAARANAHGALPYAASWIEKGPVAMGIFQLLGAAFGEYNFAALAAAWILFAAAGAWLASAVARDAGAERSSIVAGVLFAASITPVGGTFNTEIPALVPATAAVWLAMRSRPLLSGVLVAVAFLCRQNAGILWPILAGAALRRRPSAGGLRDAAWTTAGFAAPVGGVAAIYALTGHWDDFVFCFWEYNRSIYVAATQVTTERLLEAPWTAVVNFLVPVPVAALLGGAGFFLAGARGRLLALSAAALTLSLFAGLRFFSHYFALALPLWCALGAITVERAIGWAGGRFADPAGAIRARSLVAALVLVALGADLATRPWAASLVRVAGWVGNGGLAHPGDPLRWPGRDPLASRTAGWIRGRATPEDRVFVWGMRPHVYAYTGLVPATRFTTCTFLTGLVPWERVAPAEDTTRWIVPGAWDRAMRELETERPRFVVDASKDHLFGDGAYAIAKFPRLAAFLARDYESHFQTGTGDTMEVWVRKP